ncbi:MULTISPECIES: hypothetical protein [Lactobacillaceae]|uniref:Uncharacterized protein n=1 Tax=Pediococcus pentosaceus TaxID=1255 RepID=A0AA40XAQ4_PEDPE|nr:MULTISPECIES: hypothetical protein [Lactobacillaceae]KAF0392063.1 hypothetical protein GBO69_09015 [Pediococcus pentosaceus]KAF0500624.1 hypothetical protein GBP22_10210 [Pediococcus pentosaceus]MBF7108843.1 hypothetical protein [Pediococcus pentosaceus]MBF7128162.1 hypothetical protein [Pediococcus pentosaceus]PKX57645.1 hypothetical protein CUR48_14440 [Lactiplantibacillus plantarum]
MLGSVVVPSAVALADTTNQTSVTVKNNNNSKSFDELYSNLSSEKKKEFQEIVQTQGLNHSQQYQILQDRETQSNEPTTRWKLSVLKKAVKYAAQLVGTKIKEKTLTEFVNYLTDFEDDMQTGLENGMVKYFHVNRTTAKWVAKTVMFVIF